MSDIEKAIALALEAHRGQSDKAGKPYILHPLRLALKFENEEEMVVAVLHDVVEDSDLTLQDLSDLGFSNTVTDAIGCISKAPGESYDGFISRVLSNEIARRVKIEDIKDNLDLTRLQNVSEEDLKRVKKYHRALRKLTLE